MNFIGRKLRHTVKVRLSSQPQERVIYWELLKGNIKNQLYSRYYKNMSKRVKFLTESITLYRLFIRWTHKNCYVIRRDWGFKNPPKKV